VKTHSGAQLLVSKLGTGAAQMRYLPRAFRLVREAAGRWTFLWLALIALLGLVPVAVVYLTRPLVDHTSAAVGAQGSWEAAGPALGFALLMALAVLLGETLRAASGWVATVQSRLAGDHLSALVQAKSTQVDIAFYEWPDFHDHLHRARHESRHRPVALLETCGSFLQNAITLGAMALVLLAFGWWMSLALVASTLPALVVVLRHALRQHEWRRRTTADERRAWYLDWLTTSGEAAAELRLFGLGVPFRAAFVALRARLRGEELELAVAQARAELAATVFAWGVAGACLAWVLWQAIAGAVGLGDAALFYVAFTQGQRLMRSLLSGAGQIYQNILFLGNLFAFLDLETRLADPPVPARVPEPEPGSRGLALRFEGVRFGYPDSERAALPCLDLAFAPGRITAIVGPNGAGKSTLVKLACRFYDPDAGRVSIGGVDLRALRLEDARRLVTVLFQEPMRYDATVAENIAVGCRDCEMSDVKAAARAAGVEELVASLPRGYETLLGRWFEGGVELSVGEWQRLALARAFFRPAPVILLDEPTSAMDSWAEVDWLRRFRALAAGRTAIVITHRFTTAMQADVIHVMQRGTVVESGTHAELLERQGLYARSWGEQMRSDARLGP
jgi:ATP-binding cassette subfamily B protein